MIKLGIYIAVTGYSMVLILDGDSEKAVTNRFFFLRKITVNAVCPGMGQDFVDV